jgi:pyruvate dehydrogenase E1 component alpha subunit
MQALRRVIGDGAGEPDRELDGLDEADLRALFEQMVLMRTYDERSLAYQRQGRIGTYAMFWGHEAIQVGGHYAFEDRDWVFPTYRESALGLLRGVPATTVLAWWRGHPSGWWNPADHRLGGISVPIGTQVPHAAGAAWGLRAKGGDECALVFFGDGATSEGSFHEGANFAAVMQAPLVLLCNNNQWAITTPYARQSRAAVLADKAIGYGMPGVRVDGGDVLAVFEAAREAVERARAGDGPTFIEALTYRMVPHGTADDPSLYIDAELVEVERRRECVVRFEQYLIRLGVIDAEEMGRQRDAVNAMVKEAMREVERLPDPDPALVFDTTYANPPASLLEQREAALAAERQSA